MAVTRTMISFGLDVVILRSSFFYGKEGLTFGVTLDSISLKIGYQKVTEIIIFNKNRDSGLEKNCNK